MVASLPRQLKLLIIGVADRVGYLVITAVMYSSIPGPKIYLSIVQNFLSNRIWVKSREICVATNMELPESATRIKNCCDEKQDASSNFRLCTKYYKIRVT